MSQEELEQQALVHAMQGNEGYMPTDLELAIMGRGQFGFPAIGPLTQRQAQIEQDYLDHQEESWQEYQAQEAAGGRTICANCGQRSVKHRLVCTLGYAGHPGAEQSDLATCENCGKEDLAG